MLEQLLLNMSCCQPFPYLGSLLPWVIIGWGDFLFYGNFDDKHRLSKGSICATRYF